MGQPFIVPVPLLTPQVRSAHPFFVGSAGQTGNSENIWADERQRIRRRPALIKIGDNTDNAGIVTGLYEYQFRDRASKAARFLVGFTEPTTFSSGLGGVSILTAGNFQRNFGGGSFHRLVVRGATHSWSTGGEFDNRENVVIYETANNGSDDSGTLYNAAGFVITDNVTLGFGALPGDGSMVIACPTGASTTILSSGYRVADAVNGNPARSKNVLFSTMYGQSARQSIWSGGEFNFQTHMIPSFQQFGRDLFFTDNSFKNELRRWGGGSTGATLVPDAPRGKFLFTHQGRLWMGGLRENSAAIIGSGALDPLSWRLDRTFPGDPIQINIEQDDRDEITGASQSFRGDLYIWKRNSLHRIRGEIRHLLPGEQRAPFTSDTVTRSIGCSSHRTITHVGNDIYWMSDRGVHSLSTTDRFGDVETAYLSFPIADVFEDLSFAHLEKSQAVFLPRVGLYMVGVPRQSSTNLNRILALAVSSRNWMIWDVGDFTSIVLGPPLGDAETVYVAMADGSLAVLDLKSQTDMDLQVAGGQIDVDTLTGISTKLEPGDLFSVVPEGTDPMLRYAEKSVRRVSFYIAPPGNRSSTLKYSWDGGTERDVTIDLNPQNDAAIKLGSLEGGNALGSANDTAVSSVPIIGKGRMLRYRIEDSNPGALPYLHSDVEAEITDKKYSMTTREN